MPDERNLYRAQRRAFIAACDAARKQYDAKAEAARMPVQAAAV